MTTEQDERDALPLQDERAAFEAWCNRTFVVNKLSRWRDGYEDVKFAYAWEAWQARAAMAATPAPAPLAVPTDDVLTRIAESVGVWPSGLGDRDLRFGRAVWQAATPAPAEPAFGVEVHSADANLIGKHNALWVNYMALKDEAEQLRERLAATPAPAPNADAQDAERYRWLREKGFAFADVSLGTDYEGQDYVTYRIGFHLPEPAHNRFEDDEWGAEDIDAAIDAARAGQGKEASNERD